MKTDSTEARYRRCADVDESQVGERMVLYHAGRERAVILNPSGTRVWSMLEQPRSVADLAAGLREAYPEVDASQAEADVKDYLAELQNEGVVERDD